MRRHPYFLAIVIATLLALVVWLFVPKEYTAVTKLSDEYRETELAIGFSNIKAHLKNLAGAANHGINDMGVYSKILKTEDFARSIALTQLPGRGMTFGQYLDREDTIRHISDHINYNYSNKHATLSISFTDRDPEVAALMLDSITGLLQDIITQHRHEMTEAALENARKALAETKAQYIRKQQAYNQFVDNHANISTRSFKQQEEALAKELKTVYGMYRDAAQQYARQLALKQRSYCSFAVIHHNSVPHKPNNNPIGYILCFVTVALLITHAVRGYQSVRHEGFAGKQLWDYFSPWMLTAGIWGLILGLYYIIDTELYPIKSQFYYCLMLWLPIFCICALSAYLLAPDSGSNLRQEQGIQLNKSLFNLFFAITLVITPLYAYRVYQIVIMFGTDDLLNNVRTLAVYGEGQGFLNYSHVLNQALFVVALWARPKIPTWQVVVLGLACLLNSLAIMEKGTILFIFISTVFVLFEKKVIPVRTICVFGAFMILFFYIFNLARAEDDSEYQKEETLLEFFAMYALSPPVAFCQLLPEVTPQFGTNTFGTVYLFLERFGIHDIVIKDKLQEFVYVPIPTNVYTIFQPFFIDFGLKGIAFFAAVYGSVAGWLYRHFRNGDSTCTCLYTYAVYVLVLQFYQENIFLSMVFVTQFVFFVVLFTQQKLKLSL